MTNEVKKNKQSKTEKVFKIQGLFLFHSKGKTLRIYTKRSLLIKSKLKTL